MVTRAKGYIPGVDGLRALAVMMVFAVHAWGHAGAPEMSMAFLGQTLSLDAGLQFGARGVDIFLIISGFLLSLSFWRAMRINPRRFPIKIKHFYERRFLRIYPTYLCAVVFYALVHDTDHALPVRLLHLLSHLLLIHNFFEATIYNLSAPLWFMATLFQLYFLLPLILYAIWRLMRQGVPAWMVVDTMWLGAGLFGVLFFGAVTALLPLELPRVAVHSPAVNLVNFVSGVGCGYIYIVLKEWMAKERAAQDDAPQKLGFLKRFVTPAFNMRVPSLCAAVLVVWIALVALTSDHLLGIYPSRWPGLSLLFSGVVLSSLLSNRRFGVKHLLEWHPLRFLGVISFSFYLYHDFLLWLVFNRWPEALRGVELNTAFGTDFALAADDALLKSFVAFILTVAVSWLLYELIERRLTSVVERHWYGAAKMKLRSRLQMAK